MIPPYAMYFSFGNRNFGLWFPLFILWPFGLLIFLIIMPFWILATIALIWLPGYRQILKVPLIIHNIICSSRGMVIEIQDKNTDFSIKFL